jgi:hypothetical protein
LVVLTDASFIADLRQGDPFNSQAHRRADLHPEKERRCRVKEYEILH